MPDDSPADDPRLLDALKARGTASTRYSARGEVAQGGMGIILRVWDQDLRRHLAMKVMFEDQAQSPARVSRFLEEAQVTGQLDHPGIVPVHELGIDPQGRVFFTMKLVQGVTLAQVFDHVAKGVDGWNTTRALSVVLRVCEAMAFAHDKGVIHRDLKPANIMVGKFGETYVMDWGLARVLGHAETKDVRPRAEDATSAIRTERRDSARMSPNSSLLTMDGDQVGTPAYMPPEQAEGDLARVGPQSDVYAVGAILYHLLAQRMPYVDAATETTPWEILARVTEGPPKPLRASARDVPAELEAICEKAMARTLAQRYASMTELADDLRAYLEHRVVKAYETGALAETRKWIARNKSLATAAAALIVVLGVAIVIVANKNREVGTKNAALIDANVEVTQQREAVTARKSEFDQLAGVVHLETARRNEQELYPPWPERIDAMERWLATDAAPLLAMRPLLAKTIADLELRAVPASEGERERARAAHPRFGEWTSKRAMRTWFHTRFQGLVSATPRPLPPLPKELASKSAYELNQYSWRRVTPAFDARTFGEEEVVLAAMLLAREKYETTEHVVVAIEDKVSKAGLLDTLAWAYFANGRDADARATSAEALDLALPQEKAVYSQQSRFIDNGTAAFSREACAKEMAALDTAIAEIEAEFGCVKTWAFTDESQTFLHATLSQLAADVDAFERGAKANVDRRLVFARRVEELTLHHPNATVTWDEAREAIKKGDDVVASKLYRARPITLKPQVGLVPIGMNPITKLWEFYDLRSACDLNAGVDPAAVPIPRHASDGSISIAPETGIVFVLIPGGSFREGAQRMDPTLPNFDPFAKTDEEVHAVVLAPFFLARHELTRAQWRRLTDSKNPSWFKEGERAGDELPIGPTHPVESVSWIECDRTLRSNGCTLPTESQWEYAARAGTSTPWWTGAEASSLAGAANVLDERAAATQPEWGRAVGGFDDGFVTLSPVGHYKPNPFGLYDVHGNVWEWCLDLYAADVAQGRSDDGLRLVTVSGAKFYVDRGGSVGVPAPVCRSSARDHNIATYCHLALGVRVARALATD